MLKNYLKTALSNVWRSRTSTLINLSGLTLGVTTSLILFLLVRQHSRFDKYHSNYNRIYRAVTSMDGNQGRDYTSGVYPVMPEAFKNDFHEAEAVVFTSYRAGGVATIPPLQGEPKKYQEKKGIVYAQSEFFKIFDRKILIGASASVLDEPNQAILSKKSALKYFGKEEAIG